MITRGKQKRPFFAILYGQPGVGKTTLAAQLPNSIFLDLEKGTSFLDAARLQPEGTISEALEEIEEAMESYDSLIIDSLSSLELKHQREVCDEQGWPHIDILDYGKSRGTWKTKFIKLITDLDRFREAGKNVLIVAHQGLRETKDPISQENYDHFSFECHKEVHKSILSHIDGCFFLKQKGLVNNDKVIGNGSRVLFTKDRPQYTAKSRWDLPEQIENPGVKFWEQLI
jgi:hypothetical protein